jgi:predicted type IV restriction endonuclease
MSLIELLNVIRTRLQEGAYQNEAAVSVGVVLPVLRKLGWDDSDPRQIVPEFSMPGGRVDFALFGSIHQPSVFLGSGPIDLLETAVAA